VVAEPVVEIVQETWLVFLERQTLVVAEVVLALIAVQTCPINQVEMVVPESSLFVTKSYNRRSTWHILQK
jgi:hypothetical protein